jgi:hypothetical protein
VGGFLRGAQAGGADVRGAAALEGVSWEEGGGLGIGCADWGMWIEGRDWESAPVAVCLVPGMENSCRCLLVVKGREKRGLPRWRRLRHLGRLRDLRGRFRRQCRGCHLGRCLRRLWEC